MGELKADLSNEIIAVTGGGGVLCGAMAKALAEAGAAVAILDIAEDAAGELADEINDAFWDDTDTACHDCTQVFDARERGQGGFDSDVARDLHSTTVDALLDAVDGDSE